MMRVAVFAIVAFSDGANAQVCATIGAALTIPLSPSPVFTRLDSVEVASASPGAGYSAALEYRWRVTDSIADGLGLSVAIGVEEIVMNITADAYDSCVRSFVFHRSLLRATWMVGGAFAVAGGLQFSSTGGGAVSTLFDVCKTADDCGEIVT